LPQFAFRYQEGSGHPFGPPPASKIKNLSQNQRKGLEAMMKILRNIAIVLLLGVGIPAVAQDDRTEHSGANQDMHDAGRDTKSAAHHAVRGTEKGTKKAYRATKRGTKKVVHKSAEKTGEAADKVRDKTQ
jgi:hypothetical protein